MDSDLPAGVTKLSSFTVSGSDGKKSAWNTGDDPRFNLAVGKIPWRREWLPTAVFLLGESHGQRRLVGYSPWGHKEFTTEAVGHNWAINTLTEALGSTWDLCTVQRKSLICRKPDYG